MHPKHDDQIVRLNRIEGQVRGIKKMVEENRYCIDIIQQCNSVTAALHEVKKNILQKHLNHCVLESFRSGDPQAAQKKIDEIAKLMNYMGK